MDVLVVGEAGFPAREVIEALGAAGHDVVSRDPRRKGDREGELANAFRGGARYDAVVDLGAQSAEDVRAALEAIGSDSGHYVLVSSCEVYPNLPRTRPWSAEAIDLTDEAGLPTLSARCLGLRAAERELRIRGKNRPWTILRPAIVEGPGEPEPRALAWVSRILDGGPLVLPDAHVATYRHLAAPDLGRAIAAILAKSQAFSRTLDVAGEGLLSPWGHAAMLMDGLHKRVPVQYVPAPAWRAAGLSLPYDDVMFSAFVEPSRLLFDLGFRPTDELAFTHEFARNLAELPRIPDARRELERRLADEARVREPVVPGRRFETSLAVKSWALTAMAGAPASLRFEPYDHVPPLATPVLRLRRAALGLPERMLLAGDLPTRPGKRVPGHNALLEVVEGGPGGFAPGTLCLPVSKLPCDVPTCAFCRDPSPRVLGLDVDGYAARFTTTPATHLVPVPREAEKFALFADPLAAIASVLEPAIASKTGPIWISGRTVEAALAGYVAADAGQPVRHVDRLPLPPRSNGILAVEPLEGSIHAVRHNHLAAPAIAIELSGSIDLARQMSFVLPAGGLLLAHRAPPVLPENVVFQAIPPCAPGRAALEAALARLGRWSAFRDLTAHVGPSVSPEIAYDAFLPTAFTQPLLEEPA